MVYVQRVYLGLFSGRVLIRGAAVTMDSVLGLSFERGIAVCLQSVSDALECLSG
jgi:hypothetical protein